MADEPAPLAKRTLQSARWRLGVRIASRAVGVVRNVALARLLLPEHFGQMGVAILSLSIAQILTEPGFKLALIQKKDVKREELDTAWTVLAIRALVVAAILVATAPLWSGVFDDPAAVGIVRMIGLGFLITGLRNIGLVLYDREVRQRPLAVREMTITVLDLLLVITFAFILRNAWALAFAFVGVMIVDVVTSYLIHPFRPRPILHWVHARELFRFGRWVSGTGVLDFISDQSDDLVVGAVQGTGDLGGYQVAWKAANLPIIETANVVLAVAFPAIARMEDDMDRIRRAALRILHLISFVVLLPLTGVLVLAEPFVVAVLGDRWQFIAPVMQVLTLSALGRAIDWYVQTVLLGVGRAASATLIKVVQAATLLPLIYPMTARWGMEGAAAAVGISVVVSQSVGLTKLRRSVGLAWGTMARAVSPAIVAAAAAGASMGVVAASVDGAGLTVLLAGAVGIVAYIVVAFSAGAATGWGPQQLIGDLRRIARL